MTTTTTRRSYTTPICVSMNRITWAKFEAVTEPPRTRPAGAIDNLPKPRPLRIAANDNHRPRGMPVPLPEHTERRVASNGKSTPMRIRANLQRTAPDAFRTLMALEELLHPPRVAANDNDADEPGGTGHERVHNQGNIRPSIPAVMRAFADGERFRGGVRYQIDRDGHEFVEIGGHCAAGEFRGLQFFRGEMIAYSDDKGRKKIPKYEAGALTAPSKDKEEKEAERQEQLAGLQTYLGPIVHGYLMDCYRIRKKRLSFFSPGIAWQYGRLAGISEAKGIGEGKTRAPAHEVLAEIDRAATAKDSLSRLDNANAARMRRLLNADSFAELALAEGASPTSAHKVGRGLCIKTLQKIEQLLAA